MITAMRSILFRSLNKVGWKNAENQTKEVL